MSEERWAYIKVPEGIRKVFSEAMWLSDQLNQIECDLNPNQAARQLDAFERIFADFRGTNLWNWLQIIADRIGDDEYKKAVWFAFERDSSRCVICARSHCNAVGALEPHHIIPRSHAVLAKKVCGELHTHRNIVCLCHEHHEMVTNPPDPTWHWRNIAPRFFELIGEPDLAIAMRENKEDG